MVTCHGRSTLHADAWPGCLLSSQRNYSEDATVGASGACCSKPTTRTGEVHAATSRLRVCFIGFSFKFFNLAIIEIICFFGFFEFMYVLFGSFFEIFQFSFYRNDLIIFLHFLFVVCICFIVFSLHLYQFVLHSSYLLFFVIL